MPLVGLWLRPAYRWVETYRQQQQRIYPEPVNVQRQSPSEGTSTVERWAREEKAWIRIMLHTTGFEHILPSLIFSTSTAASDGALSTSATSNETTASPILRRAFGPHTRSSSLIVSLPVPSTSSPPLNQGTTLATLRTSSPSCPACRGPVHILFVREHPLAHTRARRQSLPTLAQRSLRIRKILYAFPRGWWKEYLANVTGRSLLIRLAAQYSFLLVLVSMIKATGRRKTIN